MMLYPAMGELNAQIHNRYMLVNVVARRARQIAEAYENAHQILNDKPVTMAINEVADGILQDPEQVHERPEGEAETAETEEITEADTDDAETQPDADGEAAETETDSQAVETDAATESEAAVPDAE